MYATVNNLKTFYSVGNGAIAKDQPSVIFLHGAGMDHTVWVLPARYFARHHYNFFSLDFPGNGRSEGPPLKTVEALSDWLAEFMKVLEIDQAAIVGHSMGSLVSINFAARYPDKTRVMALLGTSTPMPVTPVLLDAAKDNNHDAIDMTNTWSHSSFGQMGGSENPGMCMMVSGQRLLERSKENAFFTGLNACNDFVDGDELVKKIEAETLVIIGKQDKMTAAIGAQKVASAISNARVCLLSPCGHSMLSEQPNAVLDALATIV